MTEPSKAAIEKANALVRAATPPNVLSSAKIDPSGSYIDDAFARFIDHVSEVAKRTAVVLERKNFGGSLLHDDVSALILPDPEPDVLESCLNGLVPEIDRWEGETYAQAVSRGLKAELAKRGGRIVFDGVKSCPPATSSAQGEPG